MSPARLECRLVDDDELERLAATVDDRPPRDLLRRLVATVRQARHDQALAERRCARYAAAAVHGALEGRR